MSGPAPRRAGSRGCSPWSKSSWWMSSCSYWSSSPRWSRGRRGARPRLHRSRARIRGAARVAPHPSPERSPTCRGHGPPAGRGARLPSARLAAARMAPSPGARNRARRRPGRAAPTGSRPAPGRRAARLRAGHWAAAAVRSHQALARTATAAGRSPAPVRPPAVDGRGGPSGRPGRAIWGRAIRGHADRSPAQGWRVPRKQPSTAITPATSQGWAHADPGR